MKQTSINLDNGGRAVIFPSGLVVFNFADDDDGKLSQIVSSNPGMPVVFLSTRFNRDVFSQAEGRNRTFVMSAKYIDRNDVDPTYPAQWLSEGDTIPDVPGNVSVTATDRGFIVETLSPDPQRTAYFL